MLLVSVAVEAQMPPPSARFPAVLFPLSATRAELNHGTFRSEGLQKLEATYEDVVNSLLAMQRDFDFVSVVRLNI